MSLSKFSDVLPAFTCANAVGSLWSICLVETISILIPSIDFCEANITGRVFKVNGISWSSVVIF